ncbi:MAG: M6 family metalloprotease domain-containing protein [Candidatus Krumholzibacteriota bacterium]|nr:M6 family metalloprotease domain-containing protein [Candidatus Krumholzibacteriota bacterium]
MKVYSRPEKTIAHLLLGPVFAALLLAVPGPGIEAGVVSPKKGGALPPSYQLAKKRDKNAFTLKNTWLKRKYPTQMIPGVERPGSGGQRLGSRRERPISGEERPGSAGEYREFGRENRGFESESRRFFTGGSLLSSGRSVVSGRMIIPVITGKYSDTSSPPVNTADLQRQLFDGPWSTGTLGEYYREASSGLLEVTGNVFDWVSLDNNELYYTGYSYIGPAQGTDTLYSHTDEMIAEIVLALDAQVDFGLYDNDGPDGYPNSGDDDGFVDLLVVVHSTAGAECEGGISTHMWSHSWQYSRWNAQGEPLVTADQAAGGGNVKIEDYIVAPSLSCESGMIEIGVFCHELGHSLGLPDLYDYNGGGSGVGYWGLMGEGNWNTPRSPAHPCAWSKEQLGWVEVVEIDWRQQRIALEPILDEAVVVKLVLPTERFRRRDYITGFAYALICGYTAVEASGRGWPGGAGYGNDWDESMVHTFSTDGSLPCLLQYGIGVDVEADYDFARLLLERGGEPETLAVYTGRIPSINEEIDLSSYLPGGACDFTLRFSFQSDWNVSDEDNHYDSEENWALNIDYVRINGGGIDYFSDFEEDAGGWVNDSAAAEYFVVSRRQRKGFDSFLPGEGLLIWHAENSIAYSDLGNSGGYSNSQARGVVLEEADGNYDLLFSSQNNGDGGDPFPGITGNRSFTSSTLPGSQSNSGFASPVRITEISSGAALFKGGMPAPVFLAVFPDTVWKPDGMEITLDISGENFRLGASSFLSRGELTLDPSRTEWLGPNRILSTFLTNGLLQGDWDLTVVSGDGQEITAPGALRVESSFLDVRAVSGRNYVRLSWSLDNVPTLRGCLLFRSSGGGGFEPLPGDTIRGSGGEFEFEDSSVEPEVPYRYLIKAYFDEGMEEFLLPGEYSIELYPFITDQNYPNPFRDRTTISFFAPEQMIVAIDIYDVSGRRIDTIGRRRYDRGTHAETWEPDPSRVSPGLYFCVFDYGKKKMAVKMVLVR